tara:strand:+ start:628 stop:2115 length:1488 start_codon:yes stop_codon:yes gene_type:complete
MSSKSYDKNKLKKLDINQCTNFINSYDNDLDLINPITGKKLTKTSPITKSIIEWCNSKVLKSKSKSSSSEIEIDYFTDIYDIKKYGKNIYNSSLNNNEELMKKMEKKLKEIFKIELKPLLDSKREIINQLIYLYNNRRLNDYQLNNIITYELNKLILDRLNNKKLEKNDLEELHIYFYILNISTNITNGLSQVCKDKIDYLQKVIKNKSLYDVSEQESVSSSPLSGNKRWKIDSKEENKRQSLLDKLNEECIDMIDIITQDDFTDYSVEKLKHVVKIGKAKKIDGKEKYNCLYSKSLFNLFKDGVIKGTQVKNPYNIDEILEEEDLDKAIKVLKKIYPNLLKPTKRSEYNNNIYYKSSTMVINGYYYMVFDIVYRYEIENNRKYEVVMKSLVVPIDYRWDNEFIDLREDFQKLVNNGDMDMNPYEGILSPQELAFYVDDQFRKGNIISKKPPFKYKYENLLFSPEVTPNLKIEELYITNFKIDWDKYVEIVKNIV